MTTGRPRASSREMISDAACELFLERGFPATTIADIARRAGVSRSSFFNYFDSKSDVLWSGLDARIGDVVAALAAASGTMGDLHDALDALAEDFTPDSLALAIVHADAMDLLDELTRDAALRRSRIADAVAAFLRRAGREGLEADVAGAAYAAATLAAIDAWAHAGAGRHDLSRLLAAAVAVADRILAR